MGYQSLRINVVDDDVSVAFMTGSEDNQLIVFTELLEALSSVWTDVDASFDDGTVGKFDWQENVAGHVRVLIAVNQSLV